MWPAGPLGEFGSDLLARPRPRAVAEPPWLSGGTGTRRAAERAARGVAGAAAAVARLVDGGGARRDES